MGEWTCCRGELMVDRGEASAALQECAAGHTIQTINGQQKTLESWY
jgi:hypothetical protein